MKMRAMVCRAPDGRLHPEERDLPEPGRHEVRVRVQACGVCHSDASTVEGHMPGIVYPRIPGHEVIGIVETIGDGVEGWGIGGRVGVGWFGGACGWCGNCRRGELFSCETVQEATGVSRDGGYATHMIARASALARVPAELDSVAAAPLLCAGVTTYNALRNSGARPGDVVAVQGVGGLGHLGIQFAARSGFHTVAIGRGRDKEALARSLGAHDYIDGNDGDPAEALRVLGGARAILATAPSSAAMAALVGGLGVNGVMMVIGIGGPITVDPVALLQKRAALRGWYGGTAVDSEDTLAFSALAGVASLNEVYPLDRAQDAYERMASGKARFRVVLKMD